MGSVSAFLTLLWNSIITILLIIPVTFLALFRLLVGRRFGFANGAPITIQRAVLALLPSSHPSRPILLRSIAANLAVQFHLHGTVTGLNEAITLLRDALLLCPPNGPLRSDILSQLSLCLRSRFEQLGTISDLNEAIDLLQTARGLPLPRRMSPSQMLNNVALCLATRFNQQGESADLEEAISLLRDAVELSQPNDQFRSNALNNLACQLLSRFQHQGVMADLNEAITLHQDALQLRPRGHPNRSNSLSNLSHCLATRFQHLHTTTDLDTSIELLREALPLSPSNHYARAQLMNNLAEALVTRFNQFSVLTDLDEAITLHRGALHLRPQDHPDRSVSLNNLSRALSLRFDQLGAMVDLEEAMTLLRDALHLSPPGHQARSYVLNTLAACLSSRFRTSRIITDLEEAITIHRDVLHDHPKGHPNRSISLSNLAISLYHRFHHLAIMADLEEAITLLREALALTPSTHHIRFRILDNLAQSLTSRFQVSGAMADLDEAITLHREAMGLCQDHHPARFIALGRLARCLLSRVRRQATKSDLDEIFDLFSDMKLSDVSHTGTTNDLAVCKGWVWVAEEYRHHTTLLAYQTSLQVLTNCLATLPSLPQHLTILRELSSSLAVDAFSACLRHNIPMNAVELLEQGRAVFWNQLIRLRSPLDQVRASGEKGVILADKFMRLTSRLRNILDSPSSSQHDQAWHLNTQLQDVVSDIRKLPGLSRFLQPPLFSDLQQAAIEGPVIIANDSQYGCDSLIIRYDKEPIHIPLSITHRRVSELAARLRRLTRLAKANDVMRDLVLILRELWNSVVYPIVMVLQDVHPHKSRIWWCPTAEFSILPLHAAGAYRKGDPNLSDLYVSSYTPTLTALIRARQPTHSDPTPTRERFMAVSQAQAIGENELVSVTTELSNIAHRLAPIATVTRIEGSDAKVAKVTEALRNHEFVHLACHGILNLDRPFESAFALQDGHLKIEDIMRYDMRNARFAFLSACHTTVGDEESPDEGIHLAAAMQFAGFRSVVGTMWAVDDAHASGITELFYENLVGDSESGVLNHTHAAVALHKTMRSTRLAKIPFDQRILFIHIGV